MTGWMKWMKRLAGRAGTALLVVILAVAMTAAASAASYMQPYLDKVVEWGVMRGDLEGNLNEDNYITRAEFSTMVNRAFGYDKTGPTPFRDVPENSWYAEDVGIAYNVGYIAGTSATTFSPNDNVTREQAALILARILMLQPQVGENTMFTDSRSMENWSRGYIASVAQQGLISGYPDGRFGPKDNLTRGQAAIILVNALGTPLMEAGDYTLGSVWGNVTITQSGTTLRNTVIGGDLYITEGVDLGHVTLENVTVLGKIVVCGGGTSEGGEDSIILRNVTAPELLVDNLDNHLLSLKVEGDGKIDQAYIRTSAYLADNTVDGCGIAKITMDGEEDEALTLAGNVKEVINKAPNTSVSLASGQADTITVDENAVGSTLDIAAGSRVDNVNLDTGVDVTGGGDIGKLTVNSDDSTVSMLPDEIVIRPGNTANINGENMDSAAAAESSADPRLYAGYPKMKDVAPTSGTAVFSANKKGTVHWALTAVTDGSVSADELINPSAYNPKVVKRGTVSLTGAGKEGTTNISGLISDGSYYLSAVFVDARENRSPLKVISFTTPDNTKPDFASGYPYLSKITNISAQVTTMATKSCRLYWAVLPKGATAPTAEDFKANAVTGNLGFGSTDVTKNTAYSFDVNNVPLEELESYDLYLWLTDVDNGQSSAVKKLSFTTVDKTPPVFNTNPTVNKIDKTSVGLYANLNEDGTLYWVVVAQGEEYPKPLAGQTGAVDWTSDTAKIQVANGMNALKSGKTNMTEGKDVSFTVSGLDPEKAYDLYYVAQDKAGNYTASIGMITIHTLDSNMPTVTQEFTKYNGNDTTSPYPNTDIRLVFSEAVQTVDTNTALVELYQNVIQAGSNDAAARETMANFLRNSIKLYVDTGNGRPEVVPEAISTTNKSTDEWVIDYRYAEITLEDGKTVITFPTRDVDNVSALNLQSGVEYYFEIEPNTIADTSSTKNIMGKTTLDPFKTVFAIVNLSNPNITSLGSDTVEEADKNKRVDVSWKLTPMTTENTANSIDWDMVIWSDTSVAFELYYRNTETGGQEEWKRLGAQTITVPDGTERVGVSLTRHFLEVSNAPDFAQLNTLKENAEYEYAIHFTQIGSLTDPNTWSQRINIGINVLAGDTNSLQTLANNLTVDNFNDMVPSKLANIGQPDDFNLIKQFSDQTHPKFASNHPTFTAGSSAVNMYLMMDRPGTLYYVIAPIPTIPTSGTVKDEAGNKNFSGADYEDLDIEGQYENNGMDFVYNQSISTPARLDIVNASTTYGANPRIKYGSTSLGPSEIEKLVEGLEPNTKYIVYFVLQGMSNQTYSPVYAYRFVTSDVDIPYITLEATNPDVAFTTSENAKLDYALFAPNQLPSVFKEKMTGDNLDKAYQEIKDEGGKITQAENPPKHENGEIMTVLEAMLKTYDQSTGKSYFDQYAHQDLKDQVQEIIQRRLTGGGTPVATGKLDTNKDVSKSVDFTSAMQSDKNATYFYCLATAQNALGSAYSFKAVDNVHIPDREPPYLIRVGTTITSRGGTPTDPTYSGTLTLTFNESLYCMDELPGSSGVGKEDTLRPVINRGYGANGTDGKPTLTSILTLIGNPGEIESGSSSTATTRSFTLKFNNITGGYQITLPTSMVLSDAAMNSTNDAFILEFQTGGGQGGFITGDGEFVVVRGDYRPQ